MARRWMLSIGAAALALLALAAPAWAGGWSVITLDSTPTNLQPGTPFDIGFTVRQHGETPLAGLKPIVRFSRADSTVTVNETAREEGPTGHYAARITLPTAGKWQWQIDAFEGPHEMTPVSVYAPGTARQPAPVAPAAVPASPPVALWTATAGATILVALAGFGAFRLGRARRARPA